MAMAMVVEAEPGTMAAVEEVVGETQGAGVAEVGRGA